MIDNDKTPNKIKNNLKKKIIEFIITNILLIFMILSTKYYKRLLIVLAIFDVLIILYNMFVYSGIISAKMILNEEKRYLKKVNPYIYLRELPNTYGIGITSLLFDSNIENDKDIVAIILDLCARKYLNLEKTDDKYIIKILKGIDDGLLSNEKYIMNLILTDSLKTIDYEKWREYCIQDGINLGLYKKTKMTNHLVKVYEKELKTKHYLIRYIFSLFFAVLFSITELYPTTLDMVFNALYLSIVLLVVLKPFYDMFFHVKNFIIKAICEKNQVYIDYLNETLTKTVKGVDELHKLYSFKEFIKDFGSFVDKKPEEVVLWDRYLSYAQVFGLTKEILNSGYKELISNSSFQIDNLDNITINNIEVNKNSYIQ